MTACPCCVRLERRVCDGSMRSDPTRIASSPAFALWANWPASADLHDADRRRQMGSAARKRAASHFSADVMVDQIESLYRELL